MGAGGPAFAAAPTPAAINAIETSLRQSVLAITSSMVIGSGLRASRAPHDLIRPRAFRCRQLRRGATRCRDRVYVELAFPVEVSAERQILPGSQQTPAL